MHAAATLHVSLTHSKAPPYVAEKGVPSPCNILAGPYSARLLIPRLIKIGPATASDVLLVDDVMYAAKLFFLVGDTTLPYRVSRFNCTKASFVVH